MRTTGYLLSLFTLLALLSGCCCCKPAYVAAGPTPGYQPEPEPEPDPKPAPWPSAEARTMKEGHAPTPFTAEQIRDALPSGTSATFRLEQKGAPVMIQTMEFLNADAEGMEVKMTVTTVKGDAMGEPRTSPKRPWTFFQSHASYEAAKTKITEETIETEAGSFECFVYTVTEAPDNVSTYWFARELPGPPVMMRTTANDEVVFKMELMSVKRASK